MARKSLLETAPVNDDKPKFRAWVARQRRAKVAENNIQDIIWSIKVSASEEWLVIEGKNSMAFLSYEGQAGIKFWDFAMSLEGDLKALLLIPAKGKIGFDIVMDDTQRTTWEYDEVENQVVNSFFLTAGGNGNKKTSLTGLTLAGMK